jgi:hypothetical protein
MRMSCDISKNTILKLVEEDLNKISRKNMEPNYQKNIILYRDTISIGPGPIEEKGKLFSLLVKKMYSNHILMVDLNDLGAQSSYVESYGASKANPINYVRVVNQIMKLVQPYKNKKLQVNCKLKVTHPDLLELLEISKKEKFSTNIIVQLTNNFMNSIIADEKVSLTICGSEFRGKLSARDLFNCITMTGLENKEIEFEFEYVENEGNSSIAIVDLENCVKHRLIDWVNLDREIKKSIASSKRPNIFVHLTGWGKMLARLGIPLNASDKLSKSLNNFLKKRYPTLGIGVSQTRGYGDMEAVQSLKGNYGPFQRKSLIPPLEIQARYNGVYSANFVEKVISSNSLQSQNLPSDMLKVFMTRKDISVEDQLKYLNWSKTHRNIQLQMNDVGEMRRAVMLSWKNQNKSIRIKNK